jgi:hypothetical protein
MKIDRQIRNPPSNYGLSSRCYDVLVDGGWVLKNIDAIIVHFIDDNRWWIVSDIPALNERISNPSFDTEAAAITFVQLTKD